MDYSSLLYYLRHSDLDKIKEFISRGGDVLKSLPEIQTTALRYVLFNYNDMCYYYNSLRSLRDEIILYLTEQETKARHAKNLWNVSEWIMYVEVALFNQISEKIKLNLIHIGSTNIIDFKIHVQCIFIAIRYKSSVEVITNLLQYCFEDELEENIDQLLTEAIQYDCSIDVIKLLVDAGANLHVIDYFGWNLFYHISCRCCYENICKSKHIIDFLVKNCVNIKKLDYKSNTIIHLTNCQYLIKLAIQNGVSMEHQDYDYYSPLMQAIMFGPKKTEILLQLGADPNSALNLYQGFSEGEIMAPWLERLIDVLLYHGADFLAYTVENESLIDFLLRNGDLFTRHLLKIVYNCMYFIDMINFSTYFPQLSNSTFWLLFIEKCKVEQDRMKSIVLNDGLTLYEFCNLKKYYKSKFVDVSVSKFVLNDEKITEDFPIYLNFIKIRIKDNLNKRWKKVLSDILENIIIASLKNQDDMLESIELNYDCLDYLSKFLNSKVLYNLFLASILD